MKQFDSEGELIKPSAQQQKSANELTKMKSDDSELIVPKTILIAKQQNSAEQIIPLASRQNEVAETDR